MYLDMSSQFFCIQRNQNICDWPEMRCRKGNQAVLLITEPSDLGNKDYWLITLGHTNYLSKSVGHNHFVGIR